MQADLELRASKITAMANRVNAELARLLRDMPAPDDSKEAIKNYEHRLAQLEKCIVDIMVVCNGEWQPTPPEVRG